MGIEDFLSEPTGEEPVAPEPVAAEPQPEPEVPPPPEPIVPAEPPKEEEPRHVPLATFLDQRDEAKKWKREAEEARAELAKRQPANAPDPFDDPAGYAAAQDAKVNEALVSQRFEISDVIARQQYGAEAVDAASAWATEQAKSNPGFAVSYMKQPHPIDWIVQQHKRDQMMADIGNDPDDYVRRRAAELGLLAPAPSAAPVAAQAAPAPVPPPPRSLASIPGSGGGAQAIPVGPLAATDALFQR